MAGGPIGVYRPEDRLTPPALRRAACDITSPRTGSSSLPCPRRPHELRASTMPSRHSFLGFAGPVDGARCELTRQGAPLFPASRQKGRPEAGCKKSPAHWGLRGAKWAGPREIATRRCDSATPSFIPPLNNKEEWPGSRSPHRRLLRHGNERRRILAYRCNRAPVRFSPHRTGRERAAALRASPRQTRCLRLLASRGHCHIRQEEAPSPRLADLLRH